MTAKGNSCIGLALALAIVWPLGALAGEARPKTLSREEPIHIVSDRLEAYNEQRMVVFTGNAVATQGPRTIRSDRLTLFYRSGDRASGTSEGMGALERVEARGHVTMTEGDRVVTGEMALFEQDAQTLIMTGDAVLREGTHVIRGERIVVFLNENRGVVESTEQKRVTATIYPDSPGKKSLESAPKGSAPGKP